jgi:hypothetical protein
MQGSISMFFTCCTLLRAKPPKGGDAESRGYRGFDRHAGRAASATQSAGGHQPGWRIEWDEPGAKHPG